MKNIMTKLTLTSALTVMALSAYAGTFYEKDGVAINGFDPVAYFTTQKATKGAAEFSSVYKGSTFRFASAKNRDLFSANPARYAPQYDGYCAYGVSKGAKAKTEGEAYKIVGGKLYLNYDKTIQENWQKNQAEFISAADKKWNTVSKLTTIVQ